jgi:hypothetical protein
MKPGAANRTNCVATVSNELSALSIHKTSLGSCQHSTVHLRKGGESEAIAHRSRTSHLALSPTHPRPNLTDKLRVNLIQEARACWLGAFLVTLLLSRIGRTRGCGTPLARSSVDTGDSNRIGRTQPCSSPTSPPRAFVNTLKQPSRPRNSGRLAEDK